MWWKSLSFQSSLQQNWLSLKVLLHLIAGYSLACSFRPCCNPTSGVKKRCNRTQLNFIHCVWGSHVLYTCLLLCDFVFGSGLILRNFVFYFIFSSLTWNFYRSAAPSGANVWAHLNLCSVLLVTRWHQYDKLEFTQTNWMHTYTLCTQHMSLQQQGKPIVNVT